MVAGERCRNTAMDTGQDDGRDAGRVTSEDSADGRWMSYAELAAARGIDRSSAFKLTLRHKWRRQKDNRGTVRVYVPTDWLGPSRDMSNPAAGDMSHAISALEGAVSALREQLERAEQGRDAADTDRVPC
jgi:hypothetical protein